MAITPLQGGPGIEDGPLKSVVCHPARQGDVGLRIQCEMTGCGAAVVDAAVAHIHEKTRGIKLRLRKPFVRQPVQITRPAGQAARQIAGHDLILPLVAFLGHGIRMDRNHVRLRRNHVQLLRRKGDREVAKTQGQRRLDHRCEPQLFDELQRRNISNGVVHQLNGEGARAAGGPAGQGLRDGGACTGMNLVVTRILAGPLHEGIRRRPDLQLSQRSRIAIDQIRVLRQVVDDLHARQRQSLEPLRFDRTDELDQVQPPAGEGRRSFHQGRPGNGIPRVHRLGVQLDGVQAIQHLHLVGGKNFCRRKLRHFDQLKALVIGQHTTALRNQRLRQRPVRHAQLVRPAQRRRRQEQRQQQTQSHKNKFHHDPVAKRSPLHSAGPCGWSYLAQPTFNSNAAAVGN